MEFEFYQELILTAFFSVLIAFLIGKIAVVGASGGEITENVSVSTDLTVFSSNMEKSEGSESKEADCSATEEELVGVEKKSFDDVKDMIRVEEEFSAEVKMERLKEGDPEIKIEEKGSLLHGEDEWEGIEKSEVEKVFAVATEFVRSSCGAVALARVSSDVQMELYGLNKIATEGPCYESQPLPLNFSARAKWQAWQRLGTMSPEAAMERYISLLSKNIPGWIGANSGEEAKRDKGNDSPVAGISDSGIPGIRSSSLRQLSSEAQRKSEDLVPFEIDHATEGSKILEQGFPSTFILNLLSPTRGAFLSIYW